MMQPACQLYRQDTKLSARPTWLFRLLTNTTAPHRIVVAALSNPMKL